MAAEIAEHAHLNVFSEFPNLAAPLASGLHMTPVCFEPAQLALARLGPTPSEQLGDVSCIIRAGNIDRKLPPHASLSSP